MANPNSPIGIRPIEGQDLMAKKFIVNASDAGAAIFKDDPVKIINTGAAQANGANSPAYIGPVIDLYDSNMIPVSYLTASTDGFAVVATNPMLRCQIQCSGTFTASAVGDCADFIATAGNTSNGQSKYEISSTLKGSTTSGQLRILNLIDKPNNAWGANNKVVVIAAQHAFLSTPLPV